MNFSLSISRSLGCLKRCLSWIRNYMYIFFPQKIFNIICKEKNGSKLDDNIINYYRLIWPYFFHFKIENCEGKILTSDWKSCSCFIIQGIDRISPKGLCWIQTMLIKDVIAMYVILAYWYSFLSDFLLCSGCTTP